jgi:hypothetical protein
MLEKENSFLRLAAGRKVCVPWLAYAFVVDQDHLLLWRTLAYLARMKKVCFQGLLHWHKELILINTVNSLCGLVRKQKENL